MAYKKSQTPPRVGEDYIYMPTTADQIILSDGTRLEQGGKLPWKLKRVAFSVTFPASGWSTGAAPYTQTIAVKDANVTDDLKADVDFSDVTVDEFFNRNAGWHLINRIVVSNGTITAYCYSEAPVVDIPVRFSGFREV